MIQTKALHATLICLLIFAIFSYTTATPTLIQPDNNLTLTEENALHNSPKDSPIEKPGPIPLGDPIEDPIPADKKH